MLDRGGDQPVALVAPRLERPAQREVVGLGAAAREDDLARLRLDGRRDLVARAVHGRTRGAALRIDARGIAMCVVQHAGHGLGDLGVHRRRRGMVQINAVHE